MSTSSVTYAASAQEVKAGLEDDDLEDASVCVPARAQPLLDSAGEAATRAPVLLVAGERTCMCRRQGLHSFHGASAGGM